MVVIQLIHVSLSVTPARSPFAAATIVHCRWSVPLPHGIVVGRQALLVHGSVTVPQRRLQLLLAQCTQSAVLRFPAKLLVHSSAFDMMVERHVGVECVAQQLPAAAAAELAAVAAGTRRKPPGL